VKVKVGPIQVIYRGTAEIVEVDHQAHRGRIEARGKETRGAGTASADVVATLHGDDDGTTVVVNTDLHITGKPAQFGRGVMADVGTKIIDSFAERLRAMLEDEGEEAGGAEAGSEPEAATRVRGPEAIATGAAAAGPGPRRIAPTPGREDDALDLLEVAGAATAKRVLPLVALFAAIAALVWWLRRR
jgi:uncharacterized protein